MSDEWEKAEQECMRRYGDLLRREPPEPRRARMSTDERAAQFMPFAALSGYEEAIEGTRERAEREVGGEAERIPMEEAEQQEPG